MQAMYGVGTKLRLTPPGSPALTGPGLSLSRMHQSSASVGSSSSTPSTLRQVTDSVQSLVDYDLSVGSMFQQHKQG